MAFLQCNSLESVTIPKSVTNIRNSAFYDCTNLTKVYFEQTTPIIFEWACFKKSSGSQTTFYFKNADVSDAFTTDYYNSDFGTKSTNYNW